MWQEKLDLLKDQQQENANVLIALKKFHECETKTLHDSYNVKSSNASKF